ncbi:Y-family DNA polymerase [Cloacibacillus evryensis]|uniref:Y-family DNA polymerase n=1 Tax=Cloacibacillus evryensis TaxID=508460 RepID=UPI0026DFC938|nr:Y-family DNA polymerase [Cloacibacillus evryensis]
MKDMASRAIGLCDCNNFFVSCERRENPALIDRPVVVLSGNDGCIVARSNEVKAMGVPMGEPYFKVRGLLERAGAAVLSGRLSLYNKISAEVMSRLACFSDVTEVYSIDEAFINLAIPSIKDPAAYCMELRKDIWRHCSIPVSVGISSTKTLAKLASHCAKHSDSGVFWLKRDSYADPRWMAQFEVGDIWGVGRRMAKRLNLYHRILTAADFVSADDLLLKRDFSVNALYTAWELRGYPVYPLAGGRRTPKSIQVSRSFGEAVFSYDELLEAVSYFTLCAARQLRAAKQRASRMGVYITTSRFRADNFYAREDARSFSSPRSLDCDFLSAARDMLAGIYREGYAYKKAGVVLDDFTDVSCGVQQLLFDEEGRPEAREGKFLLAAAVTDSLNREFGRLVIGSADNFGAPERKSKWYPRRGHSAAENDYRDRPALPIGPSRRVGF